AQERIRLIALRTPFTMEGVLLASDRHTLEALGAHAAEHGMLPDDEPAEPVGARDTMTVTNIFKCSTPWPIDRARAQRAVDDCPPGLNVVRIAKSIEVDLTADALEPLTIEAVYAYAHLVRCKRCGSKWREWRETPDAP